MPAGARPVSFHWRPGQGVDAAALVRLRKNFPCPREAMGEAWFLGASRRMYDELKGDLDALSVSQLIKPLEEITCGLSAFGESREWREWHHYLLGRLIPRAHERHLESLLEYLVCGFFALHPDDNGPEPYKGFRVDALATLGQAMMEPECWRDGRVVPGALFFRPSEHEDYCDWYEASGDFASSMLFCLKYLPVDAIEPWLRSALAIECPLWRAQVLSWCVGARRLLEGEVTQISQLGEGEAPRLRWQWSHVLRGDYSGAHRAPAEAPPFLSAARRARVLDTLRACFDDEIFLAWMVSIAELPALESALADVPDRFRDLYAGRR